MVYRTVCCPSTNIRTYIRTCIHTYLQHSDHDILPAAQNAPEEIPHAAVIRLGTGACTILSTPLVVSPWRPLLDALEAIIRLLIISELALIPRALLRRDIRLHICAVVPAQEARVAAATEAAVPFNAHGVVRC